jgi:hypothetical protein
MIRSTRVQKAERLRAARRLLADEIGMAEAAVALSRTFGLSRRQAYRYIELARAGAPPLAAENSVTITLKMPESLARGLRAHATARGVTASEVGGFPGGEAQAWLGRDRYVVPSIWSSHSIGCSLPSSNRLTTFWFLIGSAWWAAQR